MGALGVVSKKFYDFVKQLDLRNNVFLYACVCSELL